MCCWDPMDKDQIGPILDWVIGLGEVKVKKKKKGKGVSVVVRWGIKNESKGGYAPPNAEIP